MLAQYPRPSSYPLLLLICFFLVVVCANAFSVEDLNGQYRRWIFAITRGDSKYVCEQMLAYFSSAQASVSQIGDGIPQLMSIISEVLVFPQFIIDPKWECAEQWVRMSPVFGSLLAVSSGDLFETNPSDISAAVLQFPRNISRTQFAEHGVSALGAAEVANCAELVLNAPFSSPQPLVESVLDSHSSELDMWSGELLSRIEYPETAGGRPAMRSANLDKATLASARSALVKLLILTTPATANAFYADFRLGIALELPGLFGAHFAGFFGHATRGALAASHGTAVMQLYAGDCALWTSITSDLVHVLRSLPALGFGLERLVRSHINEALSRHFESALRLKSAHDGDLHLISPVIPGSGADGHADSGETGQQRTRRLKLALVSSEWTWQGIEYMWNIRLVRALVRAGAQIHLVNVGPPTLAEETADERPLFAAVHHMRLAADREDSAAIASAVVARVSSLAESEAFDAVWFTDPSASFAGISAANLRLAPVQFATATAGHSLFGAQIDFVFSGDEAEPSWVANSDDTAISEQLVLAPGLGLPPEAPFVTNVPSWRHTMWFERRPEHGNGHRESAGLGHFECEAWRFDAFSLFAGNHAVVSLPFAPEYVSAALLKHVAASLFSAQAVGIEVWVHPGAVDRAGAGSLEVAVFNALRDAYVALGVASGAPPQLPGHFSALIARYSGTAAGAHHGAGESSSGTFFHAGKSVHEDEALLAELHAQLCALGDKLWAQLRLRRPEGSPEVPLANPYGWLKRLLAPRRSVPRSLAAALWAARFALHVHVVVRMESSRATLVGSISQHVESRAERSGCVAVVVVEPFPVGPATRGATVVLTALWSGVPVVSWGSIHPGFAGSATHRQDAAHRLGAAVLARVSPALRRMLVVSNGAAFERRLLALLTNTTLRANASALIRSASLAPLFGADPARSAQEWAVRSGMRAFRSGIPSARLRGIKDRVAPLWSEGESLWSALRSGASSTVRRNESECVPANGDANSANAMLVDGGDHRDNAAHVMAAKGRHCNEHDEELARVSEEGMLARSIFAVIVNARELRALKLARYALAKRPPLPLDLALPFSGKSFFNHFRAAQKQITDASERVALKSLRGGPSSWAATLRMNTGILMKHYEIESKGRPASEHFIA